MPLTAEQADLLAKILGKMGSDSEGEVLNAAKIADELVRAAGLTWGDVIARPDAWEPGPGQWREPDPGSWQDAVFVVLSLDDPPLSDWDFAFLHGITGQASLSPRQQRQLDRIVTTCRMHAATTGA